MCVQITKDPLYKEIVEDILLYMTRDLGDQVTMVTVKHIKMNPLYSYPVPLYL